MAVNNNLMGLNGANPLSYMGVNAQNPISTVVLGRAPTENDMRQLGTFWLNTENSTPTKADIYMLVSVAGGTAQWVSFA